MVKRYPTGETVGMFQTKMEYFMTFFFASTIADLHVKVCAKYHI